MVVEESYEYRQTVSHNQVSTEKGEPVGTIDIRIPYDGEKGFGPKAHTDADHALGAGSTHADGADDRFAVAGHLVFVGQDGTDIASSLGIDNRFGAFPITIPIRSAALPTTGALVADTHEFRATATYRPVAEHEVPIPVVLVAELLDPGHADDDFMADDIDSLESKPKALAHIADELKKAAEFKPYLLLQLTVLLELPAGRRRDERPVVRRASVTVPNAVAPPPTTITFAEQRDRLQSDASGRTLDWVDTTMRDVSAGSQGPRRYESEVMELRFYQPAELFAQERLHAELEIELPDELLSGADVRLFDATGSREKRGSLHVCSTLKVSSTISLYDAFAQRRVSPFQSFVFDELVPDPIRVSDIEAALSDQRFHVHFSKQVGKSAKGVRQLIVASRRDGPDVMRLWIALEGLRHNTTREARHHWGHRYTSTMESGTLNMYVRGLVTGDPRALAQEMNHLHLSIRDRFNRLVAHR